MSKIPIGTRIKVNEDYGLDGASNCVGEISDDDSSWTSQAEDYYTVRLDGRSGPTYSGRDFWYMDESEFTVIEEKPVAVTPASIQVGVKVKVVEDDPFLRTGEFVGLVGEVAEVRASDTTKPFKVKFGDGTAFHGNRSNGHWWVAKVEPVVPFQPGDAVTWFDADGYTIVSSDDTYVWIKSGDYRYTAHVDDVKAAAGVFEKGKTYEPSWNDGARFTVKDIWTNSGGAEYAVGFYSYSAADRLAGAEHVESQANTKDIFKSWKVAE